jgi:hypothetical protein
VILDVSIAQVVLAVVLPAVVALVTKTVTSSSVKALLLLALSIVAGVLTEVVAAGDSFSLESTIGTIAGQFGMAVIAHYGLLKPTNVTGSKSPLARVGSGSTRAAAHEETRL